MLRRIFFEPAVGWFGECVWRPAADVKRTAYGWLVKVELPGVAPETVRLAARGNSLLLSGVRTDVLREEGDSYYAMEISYCPFERRIDFPSAVEGAELHVSSQDGLLIVRLRRRAEARP